MIYKQDEIEKIRKACKVAKETLKYIEKYIVPGVTTETLNYLCHSYILSKGCIPSILGFNGYPASICTSVNSTAVHGIPSPSEVLSEGDIVSIDLVVCKDGFHGDTCKTFPVGQVSENTKRLLEIAQICTYEGIYNIRPNMKISEIGQVIENIADEFNVKIIPIFTGHGVGKNIHEKPQICHTKSYNSEILPTGTVFTIEPVITNGNGVVYLDEDGWSYKTKDSSLSVQYEHTVLVTNFGWEILT